MNNQYPKEMNVLIIDEDWIIPEPSKGEAIDLLIVHESRWNEIKGTDMGNAILAAVYSYGRLIIYNKEIEF